MKKYAAVLLSLSLVSCMEAPVRVAIETNPYNMGAWVTSITDDIVVEKVTANRGTCPESVLGTKPFLTNPTRLHYGQQELFYIMCTSPLIQITVYTNRGTYNFGE